jgi:hypothetical protein
MNSKERDFELVKKNIEANSSSLRNKVIDDGSGNKGYQALGGDKKKDSVVQLELEPFRAELKYSI